jgi:hypothetical protein
MWLILLIYCDSALFVFATAVVVHGFGINSSPEVCEGGILLCTSLSHKTYTFLFGKELTGLGLICYMTTKILIYYFLVEKAVSSARFTGFGHALIDGSMLFVGV